MDAKNHHSFRSRLKRYSLLGWIRHLRLKMQGRAVTVEGDCRMCGRCCRRVSIEAGGRWLRRKEDFERLLERHPEYSRFQPVGRDSQGFLLLTCSWYRQGEGVCADHDNRLDICRNYPDVDLYFSGGEVNEGCGYRFREVIPFAAVLEKELEARNDERTTAAGD